MNRGALYAGGAYVLWGLLPLFWRAVEIVPPIELVAYRMVWSVVVVLLLLALRSQFHWLRPALRNRRIVVVYATSAVLLSINWLVYIWAVNAGYVVETSLGYFITPLVNVLLGVLLLGERLRRWQGAAIAVAAAGVVYLTISYGALPWIGLVLAASFGLYGLVRKTGKLGALEGLTMETLLLAPIALAYLVLLAWQGRIAMTHVGVTTNLLLAATGVVTAPPLLLFAAGVRRITLTLLGILQFIAPTLQFALGVFLYHEQVTATRLVGFVIIWLALVIYVADGLMRRRVALAPAG